MYNALGCAGYSSSQGFKTESEALHFAITFTSTYNDEGIKVNYDEAQKLFDFIKNNVELPKVDTSQEEMSKLLGYAGTVMGGLANKIEILEAEKGKGEGAPPIEG